MLSDAPEEHLETLEAFGESLGMAFQLSDDIMDMTASQVELGKEPGTDLREGVYTLPVLHALAEGDAPRRAAAAARRTARPTASCSTGRSSSSATGGAVDHAQRRGGRRGPARGGARRGRSPTGRRATP